MNYLGSSFSSPLSTDLGPLALQRGHLGTFVPTVDAVLKCEVPHPVPPKTEAEGRSLRKEEPHTFCRGTDIISQARNGTSGPPLCNMPERDFGKKPLNFLELDFPLREAGVALPTLLLCTDDERAHGRSL